MGGSRDALQASWRRRFFCSGMAVGSGWRREAEEVKKMTATDKEMQKIAATEMDKSFRFNMGLRFVRFDGGFEGFFR